MRNFEYSWVIFLHLSCCELVNARFNVTIVKQNRGKCFEIYEWSGNSLWVVHPHKNTWFYNIWFFFLKCPNERTNRASRFPYLSTYISSFLYKNLFKKLFGSNEVDFRTACKQSSCLLEQIYKYPSLKYVNKIYLRFCEVSPDFNSIQYYEKSKKRFMNKEFVCMKLEARTTHR